MEPWKPGGLMSTPGKRSYRRSRGAPTWRIIRYADDFVILVHGTREDTEALREDVARMLAPMGLRLSPAKTQVVHMGDGFGVLGFPLRLPGEQDPIPLATCQPRLTAAAAESPLPRDRYGGFGERPGETGRWQHRNRAPGRLNNRVWPRPVSLRIAYQLRRRLSGSIGVPQREGKTRSCSAHSGHAPDRSANCFLR
jgi:Reverse transcriptase (RNA-dependent DNA polymerase)